MPRELDRRALLGTAALGGIAWLVFRPSPGEATVQFEVTHTPAEWKQLLGPERYHVLREAGTERPFTSPLNEEHRRGTFACAGCALPLFSSTAKFESGTGWPSFYRPLQHAVAERSDHSMLMDRTEVLCARCGGHLGHVFPDGPKPTGLRYCMNGLALRFRAA
jgi:peptide-methionine (R)-S-oxide reductase